MMGYIRVNNVICVKCRLVENVHSNRVICVRCSHRDVFITCGRSLQLVTQLRFWLVRNMNSSLVDPEIDRFGRSSRVESRRPIQAESVDRVD